MNKYEIFISFVYFEKDNTKKNLQFFLKHGLKKNHYLLINCKSNHFSIDTSAYDNVKVIMPNENLGFCMKGHLDNLSTISSFNDFDYFIIMNDSVKGPYFRGLDWEDPFISKINQGFDMCGTINNHGYFNFLTPVHVKKFYDFIKDKPVITYKDAVDIEFGFHPLGKRTNLTNIKWWDRPHSPWDVIFVKQNRIGFFQGDENEWTATDISYITEEVLDKCDKEMDLIYEKNRQSRNI